MGPDEAAELMRNLLREALILERRSCWRPA